MTTLSLDGRATCYHGGAFFDAIGDELDASALHRSASIINADVLDAWFDPAPGVMAALCQHLPWALRTSPPTHADGLRRIIARTRDVPFDSILTGAGSSALIFLALHEWLDAESRVLILDPMYGEYAHVLEQVVGCRVTRLELDRNDDYAIDLDALAEELQRGYDLVVLVNPNSPTGQHVPAAALRTALDSAPSRTRLWIDETYIDYIDASESLEQWAAASSNAVVCKSMSKVYALSGARCAYLCGNSSLIDELRRLSPPWAVGLPAQIAACEALRDEHYYRDRWRATHHLRATLANSLRQLSWDVAPSCANFLLCRVRDDGPTAAQLIAACRERGLYLRDVSSMSARFDERTLRIAVKDAATNQRMVQILRDVSA
ncbi:MAG TPA: histidinol-phosphate transaminase [Gemmatimonadaceae bacterium]